MTSPREGSPEASHHAGGPSLRKPERRSCTGIF
jgi:hypothetical protein